MAHRRGPIAALLAASLLLTACAGAAEPAEPEGAPAPAATPVPGDSLIGLVGTAEDPDAYEIALTDEDGAPIASLPAGDYTLTFVDLSEIHNFRLSGPGGVDVSTEVGAVDESTVEITVEPGTYEFVCDPHSGTMRGSVVVTG